MSKKKSKPQDSFLTGLDLPNIFDLTTLPWFLLPRCGRGYDLFTLLIMLENETHRGIDVPRAFLKAYKAGKTPPPWVLDHLAEAFQKFIDLPAYESLDDLLGFKKGRGQDRPVKEKLREQRNHYLCYIVYLIEYLFKFSIANAAHMVVEREKAHTKAHTDDWKCGGFKCRVPAGRTLEDLYYATPKNIKAGWRMLIELMNKDGLLDTQRKNKFLESFPEHSRPKGSCGDIRRK